MEKAMSERDWKWFKHGHQYDIATKAISAAGKPSTPSITVFVEHKDKQDARKAAIDELHKYGYSNVKVTKVIER